MSGLGNINGWSEDDYQTVMRAAEQTFLATAKLRAALPAAPAPKDRYYPTVPRVSEVLDGHNKSKDPREWGIQVGQPGEPKQLQVEFKLEPKQINDVDLLVVLVRRAAQVLAAEEGRALFKQIWGAGPNKEIGPESNNDKDTDKLKKVINKALSDLQNANHLGPHSFIMTPSLHGRYRELLFGSSSNRLFIGDALGGDLRDGAVPAGGDVKDGDGLLISLGVSTVEFLEVDHLALSVVEYKREAVTFRLEERVTTRIIDPTAIARIRYV